MSQPDKIADLSLAFYISSWHLSKNVKTRVSRKDESGEERRDTRGRGSRRAKSPPEPRAEAAGGRASVTDVICCSPLQAALRFLSYKPPIVKRASVVCQLALAHRSAPSHRCQQEQLTGEAGLAQHEKKTPNKLHLPLVTTKLNLEGGLQ